MSHSTFREGVSTIRTFRPDDTKKEFYIPHSSRPDDIYLRAHAKWPGIIDEEITITAEHIQTYCIGYDRYDPSDYTNFLRITASDEYFQSDRCPQDLQEKSGIHLAVSNSKPRV